MQFALFTIGVSVLIGVISAVFYHFFFKNPESVCCDRCRGAFMYADTVSYVDWFGNKTRVCKNCIRSVKK